MAKKKKRSTERWHDDEEDVELGGPPLEERLAALDHAALLRLTSALMCELDDGRAWAARWLDREQGLFAPIQQRVPQLVRRLQSADDGDFASCWAEATAEIEARADRGDVAAALQLASALIDWMNRAQNGLLIDDWRLQDYVREHGAYDIQNLWDALIARALVARVAIAQHICDHILHDGDFELSRWAGVRVLPLLARLMTREEQAALRKLLVRSGIAEDREFGPVMVLLEDAAKTPAERAAQLWRHHQHGEALAMWLEAGARDEALRRAATLERPWAHLAMFEGRGDHAAVAKLLDLKLAKGVASAEDAARWVDAKVAAGEGASAWEGGLAQLTRRPGLELVAALDRCVAHLKLADEAADAIAAALKGAPEVSLCWRLDRGELEEAALVWARRAATAQIGSAALKRAAAALEATHPAVSAEMLCALSEASLSQGKIIHYQEAAALAARARDLADRAQTRAAFDKWLEQVLRRHQTNNHIKKPFKDRGMSAR